MSEKNNLQTQLDESELNETLSLLDQLSEGEDEFDVDLMACGCRLRASDLGLELSMNDITRLYGLGSPQLGHFVILLANQGGLGQQQLIDLAGLAANNQLSEPPSQIAPGAKEVTDDNCGQLIFLEDKPFLFNLSSAQLTKLAGGVINEAKIDASVVFEMAESAARMGVYVIHGTVRSKSGAPMDGVLVRAVDQDFVGENLLGNITTTDGKGHFQIQYQAEDFIINGKESGGADIILYVYDRSGRLLTKTEPSRNAPNIHSIDIVI